MPTTLLHTIDDISAPYDDSILDTCEFLHHEYNALITQYMLITLVYITLAQGE